MRAEGSLIYPCYDEPFVPLGGWTDSTVGTHLLFHARKERDWTIPEDCAGDMPELWTWFKTHEAV